MIFVYGKTLWFTIDSGRRCIDEVLDMIASACFQDGLGSTDICVQCFGRIYNRTRDVDFGCEMNASVNLVLSNHSFNCFRISNVFPVRTKQVS